MTYGIGPSSRFTRVLLNGGDTIIDLPSGQPYPVMAPGDVVVSRRRGNVRTVLLLDADYTVELIDQLPGARVVLAAPAMAGDIVDVIGARPIHRPTDLHDGQKFDEKTLNAEFDGLTLIAQELRRDVDRSWKTDYPDRAGILPVLPKGHFPISDGEGNYADGGTLAFSDQDIREVLEARDQVMVMRDEVHVDRLAADDARVEAEEAAAEATGHAADAALSALEAQNAAQQTALDVIAAQGYAEAALSNGHIYPDTGTGLAGTSSGDYFWVATAIEPTLLSLYRHEAGPVATLIGTTLTSAATRARLRALDENVYHEQRCGIATTPVNDATPLSEGDFVFAEPAEADGFIHRVPLWVKLAGTIKIRVWNRTNTALDPGSDGWTFTLASSTDVVLSSTGGQEIGPEVVGAIAVAAGQHVGFYTPSAIIPRPAGAVPYYAVSGPAVSSFFDGSEAQNLAPQIAIVLRYNRPPQQKLTELDARQGGAERRIDMLMERSTSTQIIGKAGALAAGTNGTFGHYAHATPAAERGIVRSLELWPGVTTSVRVKIYNKVGNSFVPVWTSRRYKISGGQKNTINLDVPIKKGQHVGLSGTVAGMLVYQSPIVNAGYYQAVYETAADGSWEDEFATTTIQLQWRWTLALATPDDETTLLFQRLTERKYIGVESEPASGLPSTSGILVLATPVARRAVMRGIELHASASRSVTVHLFSKSGDTFTTIANLGTFGVTAGPNLLPVQRIVEPGTLIGFEAELSAWVDYIVEPSSGYYHTPSWDGVSFDDAFVASSAAIQARVILDMLVDLGSGSGADQIHEITVRNSAKIGIIGPSYTACHYIILGTNWTSEAAKYGDWRIEAFGFGGETLESMLDRWRSGAVGGYPAVHPRDWGLTYAVLLEGINSAYSLTRGVSIEEYQQFAANFIETLRGDGIIPIFGGEARRVYSDAGHAIFQTIAERAGIDFIDMVSHGLRFNAGAMSPLFWQGVVGDGSGISNIWHYGPRSGDIFAAPLETHRDTRLPDYPQGVRAFRLRAGVSYSDIDELVPANNVERAQKWRELLINHVSLTEGTEQYYDYLTPGAGSYNQNNVVGSEYLKWQQGQALAFPANGLLVYTLDALRANVRSIMLELSDPTVSVWVKTARKSPWPDPEDGACRWHQLIGAGGIYTMDAEALAGALDYDKLVFRLFKSGGFSITEPRFTWVGLRGKPARRSTRIWLPPSGPEMLAQTTPSSLLSPWIAEGGAAASSDVTYQVPYGRTGFATVDNAKKIRQKIGAGTNNLRNRMIEIAVEARRWVPPHPHTDSMATSAITRETWNDRLMRVEVIAPGGTVFDQTVPARLWWRELPVRALLPMRVGECDVRISGVTADPIQISNVSVREVTLQ